jgi:hypothetical protein
VTGRRRPPAPLRLGLAGLLGAGAALLVACGAGSGAGSAALIPASNAGQLKSDFAAVASASSSGSCFQVIKNVVRARSDLAALPATLDARLRSTLKNGVDALSQRAQVECKQQSTTTTPTTTATTPTTPTTTTSTNTNPTTTTNTNTNTTTTNTTTTDTQSTPTDTTGTGTSTGPGTTPTGTTTSPPDNGGGTPAPNGQLGQVVPSDGAAGAGGTTGSGGGR